MIKSGTLLKITAALAAIQGTAHAALLLTYRPSHGLAESVVVAAMRGRAFAFGGFAPHSYWEMYIGYGLFAAFNCAIEAVLFWQLAGWDEVERARARPIILLFLLANLGYAGLVARFFFLVPMVFDLLIAALLAAALRRTQLAAGRV